MPIKYRSIALAIAVVSTTISCSKDSPTGTATPSTKTPPGESSTTFTMHLSSVGNRPVTTVTTTIGRSPAFNRVTDVGSEEAMKRDELRSRLNKFREKGPLSLVLVDHPLRDDAIAEVHLNSRGPIGRFMVIARNTLNDEILDRAHALARNYSMRNPDVSNEVILRLNADASFVEISGGREVRGIQKLHTFYASPKKNRRSRWLLESAQRVTVSEIPGVGQGRVMSLGDRQ